MARTVGLVAAVWSCAASACSWKSTTAAGPPLRATVVTARPPVLVGSANDRIVTTPVALVALRPDDGTGDPAIARSADGGRTWASRHLPQARGGPAGRLATRAHGLSAVGRDVFVFSTGQDVADGIDRLIVHSSTDDGRTWHGAVLETPGRHQGPITAAYRLGRRLVVLADVASGRIAGSPTGRHVAAWTSDDDGRRWTPVAREAFGMLGRYERWEGSGYVDRAGRLYATAVGHTPAGGPGAPVTSTWQAVQRTVRTVWMTTDGRRWAPTDDATALPGGALLRGDDRIRRWSLDGGRSWQPLVLPSPAGVSSPVRPVELARAQRSWWLVVSGSGPTHEGSRALYRSTDHGRTWQDTRALAAACRHRNGRQTLDDISLPVAVDHRLVAVGSCGTGSPSDTVAVDVSGDDGRSWQPLAPPRTANSGEVMLLRSDGHTATILVRSTRDADGAKMFVLTITR